MAMKRFFYMKKLIITAAFVAFTLATGAQSLNVTAAFQDMQNGNLDKAKTEIDAACLHEETKGNAKTWCYKALIYSQIGGSRNDEYNNFAPDWVEQAYIAALECQRLDTKKEYTSQVNQVFSLVAQEYYSHAMAAFNEKDYATAIEFAEKSIVGFNKSGNSKYAQDAMFTAGASSWAIRDTMNTLKYFNQMVLAKTDNNYVYQTLFNIHKAKGDKSSAMKVATTYVKNCKNDYRSHLLLSEGYLLEDNMKKSKEQINMVLKMTKDSVNLYPLVLVLSGEVLEQAGDTIGAIAKYNESLRVKPNQYEANFALGRMYFNLAADKINEANQIDPFDDSQTMIYDKLNEEANELFRQLIPYLEKGVACIDGLTDENAKASMRANLLNALGALETSYARVEMYKEAETIKARRDQMTR